MSKLLKLKNDPQEMQHFSRLVHNYQRLAGMRVMQEMRARLNLDPDETRELYISILGRQMNEAAYGVSGTLMGSDITLQELLPPITMCILKDLIINNKISDPSKRIDLGVQTSQELLKQYQEFLMSLDDRTDIRV